METDVVEVFNTRHAGLLRIGHVGMVLLNVVVTTVSIVRTIGKRFLYTTTVWKIFIPVVWNSQRAKMAINLKDFTQIYDYYAIVSRWLIVHFVVLDDIPAVLTSSEVLVATSDFTVGQTAQRLTIVTKATVTVSSRILN